ncbi:MAG TPA: hypothetical protein VNT75_27125 [Symbiobacteriaceae bacterium]|nr:hypothetical protein [Symbiobacteriaceae bacterium]
MWRRDLREERGNIYVEALIAVAILGLGLLPVFGGWSLTARARDQVGSRTAALALARSYLEPLHAVTAETWNSLPASQSMTDAANPGYTIVRTVQSRPDLAGAKDVTVTVTWKDRAGKDQSVVLATSVARRP